MRWWVNAALAAVVLAGCGAEATPSPGDDGAIPDGERVSPYDESVAAVSRLDPGLLAAVRAAADDAAEDGIDIGITSGWRSTGYQQRLLTEAVDRYGSVAEARRFVSPPDKSKHVIGAAVDIGPTDAADWMIRHGADYGLCQTYANEMWHFELVTDPGGECPPPRSDAAS